MTGFGLASADATALTVKFPQNDWRLLLRRVDFEPEASFARLHGQQVGPGDIAFYLPNWKTLAWKPVPANLLSQAESCAVDRNFAANISAHAGRNVGHEVVVAAFLSFMAGLPENETPRRLAPAGRFG